MTPKQQIQIMIILLVIILLLWEHLQKTKRIAKIYKKQIADKEAEMKSGIAHTVRPDYPTKNFSEWQQYVYKELRWPQRLEA